MLFTWIWDGICSSISFAAAESVDKKQAPKAISLLLFAGILSALLGPNLAYLG